MANVTATARIGSRVIRVVGESRAQQYKMLTQLDLFIEHVHREARRSQEPSRWRIRFTEL